MTLIGADGTICDDDGRIEVLGFLIFSSFQRLLCTFHQAGDAIFQNVLPAGRRMAQIQIWKTDGICGAGGRRHAFAAFLRMPFRLIFPHDSACRDVVGEPIERIYIVAALGALVVIVPYQLITGTFIVKDWSWPIAWCIILNALFNVVANYFGMLTLGKGNAAVYFGLCRMGFAVSFIWAVLVWGEKATLINIAGIICLISAVFLTAKGGKETSEIVLHTTCFHIRIFMDNGL